MARYRDGDFNYEIKERVATLSEAKGYAVEVNVISYMVGDEKPRIDIRRWDKRGGRMLKGISLTEDEADKLMLALANRKMMHGWTELEFEPVICKTPGDGYEEGHIYPMIGCRGGSPYIIGINECERPVLNYFDGTGSGYGTVGLFSSASEDLTAGFDPLIGEYSDINSEARSGDEEQES